MSEIKMERNPNKKQLDELGVTGWPIWTKEASQSLPAMESEAKAGSPQ